VGGRLVKGGLKRKKKQRPGSRVHASGRGGKGGGGETKLMGEAVES